MKEFAVKNPDGCVRVITAIDKFSAIAIAVERDGHKWSNSQYKIIR